VTTRDPGARLVLTQGLLLSPRSTAFRATSPAPIMTEGLEVLVQLVIAAMTTAPSCRVMSSPPSSPVTMGGASGSAVATETLPSSAPRSPIVTLAPPSPTQRE
jgi:hypothetical protein